MDRRITVALAVVAGVAVGAAVTHVIDADGRASTPLPELVSMRIAAAALCPDGSSMSVGERIGRGAANAFLSFDEELTDDDRATCGDPVDAVTLGYVLASVDAQLDGHGDEEETMELSLELVLSLATRLDLTPDIDPEVVTLVQAGQLDAAAELQREIDRSEGIQNVQSRLVDRVVFDALGTVEDAEAHDAFRRAWLQLDNAMDVERTS